MVTMDGQVKGRGTVHARRKEREGGIPGLGGEKWALCQPFDPA